jgi:hypothetical protein
MNTLIYFIFYSIKIDCRFPDCIAVGILFFVRIKYFSILINDASF